MTYDKFIDDGVGLIIHPPKKDVEKQEDPEDLEKYNQCHGYRGRFCSSGGGGGGGGSGGGLSIETEGSRLQPTSGGQPLEQKTEPGDFYIERTTQRGRTPQSSSGFMPKLPTDQPPAPPVPKGDMPDDRGRIRPETRNHPRTNLKAYVGQDAEINYEISVPYNSVKQASCIQNIAVKLPDGRIEYVDHQWVKYPPESMRNTRAGELQSTTAKVTVYSKMANKGDPNFDPRADSRDFATRKKYANYVSDYAVTPDGGKVYKQTGEPRKVISEPVKPTGGKGSTGGTISTGRSTPSGGKVKGPTKAQLAAMERDKRQLERDRAFMETLNAKKGIDVDDVHVAGPSWQGKRRSEMTKAEVEECEKAQKRSEGCPKIKKTVELFKLDDDQRLIYGVVLVPDVEDLQGDICSKEDIQEAAHDYLVNSRLIKAQHRAPTDAEVVQSYIAPIDIPIGKGIAPAGSWVMVTKVKSSAMWTAIKKGDITGYSIGGRGTREEI